MTITPRAGYLLVEFAVTDWKFRTAKLPGGAKAVISGIKAQIGHVSKNQDGFEYEEESHVWRIVDTPANRETLTTLRDWYLKDANQESLTL